MTKEAVIVYSCLRNRGAWAERAAGILLRGNLTSMTSQGVGEKRAPLNRDKAVFRALPTP